jgi:hypothetical protein
VLPDDLHVQQHRCRVGVDLDDADLGAVIARVHVERDHSRLVRLDDVRERLAVPRETLELALLEAVRADEDERAGHAVSSSSRLDQMADVG